MENKTVVSIETVIDYIEANLDGKLDLETVAEAVHYSKYHLHRMLTFWTRIERSTLRNSRQPSMPSLIFAMSVRRRNR